MKEKIIFVVADQRYRVPLVVLLRSILESQSLERLPKIYVFTHRMTPASRVRIERSVPELTIEWSDLVESFAEHSLPTGGHLSVASYGRLFAADRLAKTARRAIYLDVDMLVRAALLGGRMLIVRGDQGSVDDLDRLLAAVPALDVIIDDGSHAAWHQRLTLETLFPALNDGGFYFIEDLHAHPVAIEAELPATPRIPELLAHADYLRALGILASDVRLERNGGLAVIRKPHNR